MRFLASFVLLWALPAQAQNLVHDAARCAGIYRETPYQAPQANPACQDNRDACTYMLSVGPIFEPIHVNWLADGSLCGFTAGPHLLVGENSADGELTVSVFEASTGEYWNDFGGWKGIASAMLRKRLTDDVILWEGITTPTDLAEAEPIYLQRTRSTEVYVLPEHLRPKQGWEFLANEGHGAYYCGDGGCDDNYVYVAVAHEEVDAFQRRFRQSNLDATKLIQMEIPASLDALGEIEYDTAALEGDGPSCLTVVGEGGLTKKTHTCFQVEAFPLRAPEVTMALREFPEVDFARRSGGGAGADATSFFLNTDAFLLDDRTMDGFKAAQLFDAAIREYFPHSDTYEISEPVFQNNSIFWEIKGQRPSLDRLTKPSPDEEREWWKVRVQLMIAQKNVGSYFLALGFPETKITSWGFEDPPSDDKFTTELVNDPRFLRLRQRLMGAVARGIPGTIYF